MDKAKMQHIWADFLWALTRLYEDIYIKYFRLPFESLPTNTPDLFTKVKVEKNVAIPMRDGIKLYANIYKPYVEDRYPVILIRMPYGKDEPYCIMPAYGKYFARKGYICVVQDVRGKYASEGKFEPFVNEAADGYDTLDWVAEQTWCDGNIGMAGESYYGYTQWAVACLDHPNLKCIAPDETSADIYGTWIYHGNAFCLQTMGTWSYQMNARKANNPLRLNYWYLPLITMVEDAGINCEYFKDWIKHPSRDPYWEPINLCQKYNQVKIPVYHMGGWYDAFLADTINSWRAVKEKSDSMEARENQWLLIAPTDHEKTPSDTNKIGRLNIGEEAWSYDRLQRFFDYWLKGIENGFDQTPRVEIFTMGNNEWRYEEDWPPANVEFKNYYFHSNGNANTLKGDGQLNITRPEEEPADSYVYDPDDPVTVSLETELWSMAETLQDRARVEQRADVLVYTASRQEENLEITGPITVTLFAESSAQDTDFVAVLVDVFPDGYTHMIQEGIVRARYRNSDREASLIEPGKIYEYMIDLWSTSYVVKKGHRIRVEITSSNFNRWDRNPNTGHDFGMDAETMKATQKVYHNNQHPSHLTLPVIPR